MNNIEEGRTPVPLRPVSPVQLSPHLHPSMSDDLTHANNPQFSSYPTSLQPPSTYPTFNETLPTSLNPPLTSFEFPTSNLLDGSRGIADDQYLNMNALDPDVNEAQLAAIKTWTNRVKLCFALHVITALFLFRTAYYLTTVVGIALLIALYAYARISRLQKKHFVSLYLLVILLNLFRDIIILSFVMGDPKAEETFDTIVLTLLWIDALIVTPFTLYSCFYLYRSTAVTHLTV